MVTRYGCLLLGIVAALLLLATLLTCRITGLPLIPGATEKEPSHMEEGLSSVFNSMVTNSVSKSGNKRQSAVSTSHFKKHIPKAAKPNHPTKNGLPVDPKEKLG